MTARRCLDLVSRAAYDHILWGAPVHQRRFVFDTYKRVIHHLEWDEDCLRDALCTLDGVSFRTRADYLDVFAPLILRLNLYMQKIEYRKEDHSPYNEQLFLSVSCYERVLRWMTPAILRELVPKMVCRVLHLRSCDVANVAIGKGYILRVTGCFCAGHFFFDGLLDAEGPNVRYLLIKGEEGVRFFADVIPLARELHISCVEKCILTLSPAVRALHLHCTTLWLAAPALGLCHLRINCATLLGGSPVFMPALETLDLQSSCNYLWAGYPKLRTIQATLQYSRLFVFDNPELQTLCVRDPAMLDEARNEKLEHGPVGNPAMYPWVSFIE